jgi:hypothetical protein
VIFVQEVIPDKAALFRGQLRERLAGCPRGRAGGRPTTTCVVAWQGMIKFRLELKLCYLRTYVDILQVYIQQSMLLGMLENEIN